MLILILSHGQAVILEWICQVLGIYSSVGRHFASFCLLPIVSDAAVDTQKQGFSVCLLVFLFVCLLCV